MDLRIRETVHTARYATDKLAIEEYRKAVTRGLAQAELLARLTTAASELVARRITGDRRISIQPPQSSKR
jgi:hypothetical protein